MIRTHSRLLVLLVLAFAGFARASAESPYFHVTTSTAPGTEVFSLIDTQVDITIAGVIADVAIVQTYANHGTEPLEAVYVFPGSTRAAVHGLTMVVGERVVRAQIQKRGEARRTYEAAKASGRTATLLEQDRPNLFKMNLANIQPGERVQVELRYTEWVPQREGVSEFVLPTFVAPRYARGSSATDAETIETSLASTGKHTATFGFRLDLACGTPIHELACGTHPVRIDTSRPQLARLELDPAADPCDHADRDLIVRYRLAGDALTPGLLLSRAPGAGEGYFLATLQPPARVDPALIPARDYVFVVDVSGSMRGFPLNTTKRLLTELIASLRATDTFNIVLFAGGSAVLAPAPVAATPDNLAHAIVLLERQQAGGGTELLPALATAFATPRTPAASRTVVIVSDGLVDIEAEAFDLVLRQPAGTNLFAFGIGTSVNRHLIEGLARVGGGEPTVILSPTEAVGAAVAFRRCIESPLLTQVRLSFDGFAAADITPATLSDVFANRPVTLFGKWHGSTSGRIHLTGHNGHGPFTATLNVADAVILDNTRALELLWARAQISALEDRELAGRDAERVSAITRLGLTHGLLTKYTSFVAVDERVRSPAAVTPNGAQPTTPMPGQNVPTTPEPATTGLIALAALALAASLWRKRRNARATAGA